MWNTPLTMNAAAEGLPPPRGVAHALDGARGRGHGLGILDHVIEGLIGLVALALDQHVAGAEVDALVDHAHMSVVGDADEEEHHGQTERDADGRDDRAAAVAKERSPCEPECQHDQVSRMPTAAGRRAARMAG
jgi:hypothetical protein